MKVDIDYIWWLYRELRKIEASPLEDLELHIDGNKIDLDEKQIKDWSMTGLLNRDFIIMREYENSSSYKRLVRDNKIKKFLNGEEISE